MPAESAILAQAPDLAPLLIVHTLNGGIASSGLPPETENELRKSFQLAEAAALVSLCEESLWNDFELIPALRDDFIGDELAALGAKVVQPDGRAVRDIRERALREITRLRKVGSSSEEFAVVRADADASRPDFERSATTQYVDALTRWIAPAQLPKPLLKRLLETWCLRFGAALRQELKRQDNLAALVSETAATPEDRCFDELSRQSWRLDEVLGKLDKWMQANPGKARVATRSKTSASQSSVLVGRGRLFQLIGAFILLAAALLGGAFWFATSSDWIIPRIQVTRLDGMSERIARVAAMMGTEPVPRDVFTSAIYNLQDAGNAGDPIKPEQVEAALVDLQQKRLCHATNEGWIFPWQVQDAYRHRDTSGEWWGRALQMTLATVPPSAEDESIESLKRWRLLLPHLISFMESAPKDGLAEPQKQKLMATLVRGFQAIRMEPGRRPVLTPDLSEPDALRKRINGFIGTSDERLEAELKNVEQAHGKFSSEMVSAHRYLAEIAWRNGQLKEEQNSWIRAARTLERLEPRDFAQIAFCNQRLGISRAIAGDKEGAEEAFTEALRVTRDLYTEYHPAIGRLERKIARVFADLGDFDSSWRHHERALVALMKVFPGPSPEVAELHEEQAEFLTDYRQHAKGIALLQKGVEVWRSIEYSTSPRIGRVLGRLGNLQMLNGEIADAEQNALCQRDMLHLNYGPSSAEAREADIALAEILLNFGDAGKAAQVPKLMEPHFVPALEKTLSDSAEAALARCLYARALAQTKQPADAAAHFDRSIRVLLNTQPRPSLTVAGCLRDYGRALMEIDRKLDGLKALDDAEAELSALSRMRPRYLRIATAQIDDIRALAQKARQ